MPAQIISQPNPPPEPSLLPDSVLNYDVAIDTKDYLSPAELESIQLFRRAADYIAAAMIFLNDNVLLKKPITHDDIKPRLLGHWGTCPGLVLIYAHLNRIIRKTDLDCLYVVGPGHGAPAILSCLWLEDSLGTFLPEYTRNYTGLKKLISRFSVPGGFPSHINAETPGAIHEGGELGYALSVSFGAVMDNPDLVVACVVGDGEAETGPTATAWHAYKYIDPAESGAVLPILHVNGFKISERTILGTMDDKEITALFTGYGYQVRIVSDLPNLDNDIAASMDWALAEIKKIQHAARSGNPILKPRWPMLVLRTPKGLGGPKIVHGEFVEGSFHSHQVPLPLAKTDDGELADLQSWLESYKPGELFTSEGSPVSKILDIIPNANAKKLGQRKESNKHMTLFGRRLRGHGRNFQWDIASRAQGGRVIEILSEHTCQGMLQGYTLTGRTGLFPSYEAFIGIVHTMMVQYSKFVKMAAETKWRQPVGSLNYIERRHGLARSITVLSSESFVHRRRPQPQAQVRPRIPSARCQLLLSTVSHCLRAKNYVNLMVGSKQPTPVWLSPEEANRHCIAGASVWDFASVDKGVDPDVVLVGIGVEVTFEVIAAAALLRKEAPNSVPDAFETLFTTDRSIHFNYHGYPIELQGLLFGRPNLDRVTIDGYCEEGTTTSPFDMMICNHTDRFSVAVAAIRGGSRFNKRVAAYSHKLCSYLRHLAQNEKKYILANGKDHDDIFNTPVFD
ncbi:phosphoketolase [Pholiota molesta]|nr:phosphoketolase [Pholiota molesta]